MQNKIKLQWIPLDRKNQWQIEVTCDWGASVFYFVDLLDNGLNKWYAISGRVVIFELDWVPVLEMKREVEKRIRFFYTGQ